MTSKVVGILLDLIVGQRLPHLGFDPVDKVDIHTYIDIDLSIDRVDMYT